MKILLTGKNGQLGYELLDKLHLIGEIKAVGTEECNFKDIQAIRELIRNFKPNIIINCAAYTAVDKAEEEKNFAKSVNEVAPGVIAQEAHQLGSLFIHFSTDYIFDGLKENSYLEDDSASPLNVYGKTKLAGEELIKENCDKYIILRIGWVMSPHGKNFIKKILDLASRKDTISVVNDQYGTPTSTLMIAETIIRLLEIYTHKSEDFPFGVYHISASGKTNWYQYCTYLIENVKFSGRKIRLKKDGIVPISSNDNPSIAKRPMNSTLNTSKFTKTFGFNFPKWEEGVDQTLKKIYELDHG